ncbi:hypothetical protein MLD38_012744 [Melastoma candidum]|uniref:Uncharacterized protein n=1 Tax=Melastoma candidum TaxID=119954 RepID=A0ACB9R6S0_9MYRT|nr:hypothetical protein MLD38_012744 [Melastoma candidum]
MVMAAFYRVVLAQLLLRFPLTTDARVVALIVFGDSSVDTGNNNQLQTVAKSNFPPYGRDFYGGKPTGRFCNGRITSDFISQAFGLRPFVPAYLDPAYSIKDFVTGVCFASSGTGYDNATAGFLSVLSLPKQLGNFRKYRGELWKHMGEEPARVILTEALYIVSLGTNDFLWTYYGLGGRSSVYSIEEYQTFLIGIAEGFVTELYRMGARKITLGGIPPMGCLPLERTHGILFGGGCIEHYNNVAREFNDKLQGLILKLNQRLTGIRLVISNPYDILLQMIRNPRSFGFKDAASACCGTGLIEMGYLCDRESPFTCSDANRYVFWDSFHPTERGYAIISDYIVKTYLSQFF